MTCGLLDLREFVLVAPPTHSGTPGGGCARCGKGGHGAPARWWRARLADLRLPTYSPNIYNLGSKVVVVVEVVSIWDPGLFMLAQGLGYVPPLL